MFSAASCRRLSLAVLPFQSQVIIFHNDRQVNPDPLLDGDGDYDDDEDGDEGVVCCRLSVWGSHRCVF